MSPIGLSYLDLLLFDEIREGLVLVIGPTAPALINEQSPPHNPLIPREGQGEEGILDRPYHEQSINEHTFGTRISLPLL